MSLDLVYDREGTPIHLTVTLTVQGRHTKSGQLLVKSSTGLERSRALPSQYSIVNNKQTNKQQFEHSVGLLTANDPS